MWLPSGSADRAATQGRPYGCADRAATQGRPYEAARTIVMNRWRSGRQVTILRPTQER